MKAASINELKQELKDTTPDQLVAVCLRLARYKKENKELLTYLLFEANNMEGYIKSVKSEIEEDFTAINTTNLYYATKSLRKILRTTNKYIRYTGSKIAEAELLLHFCNNLKASKIPIHKSTALTKLFNTQVKKIKTAIATFHEDLQYDYLRQLTELE